MIDILADELRLAIQQLHGSPSQLIGSIPLTDQSYAEQIVGRKVHVYELLTGPSGGTCYAWATPANGNSIVMHAILHTETVNSAELAVQSVLLHKKKNDLIASSD